MQKLLSSRAIRNRTLQFLDVLKQVVKTSLYAFRENFVSTSEDNSIIRAGSGITHVALYIRTMDFERDRFEQNSKHEF